jgi:hypothetical protein
LAALLGADPVLLLWLLLGGLKVASPSLGGGQVAVLRLHVASLLLTRRTQHTLL